MPKTTKPDPAPSSATDALCECGCGEQTGPGMRFLRGHAARLASAVTDALVSGEPVTLYGVAHDPLEMIRTGQAKLTHLNVARLERENVPAKVKAVVSKAAKVNAERAGSTKVATRRIGQRGDGQRSNAGARPAANGRRAAVGKVARVGTTNNDEPTVRVEVPDIASERIEMLAQVVSSELYALEEGRSADPAWSETTRQWHSGYIAGKRSVLDALRSMLESS